MIAVCCLDELMFEGKEEEIDGRCYCCCKEEEEKELEVESWGLNSISRTAGGLANFLDSWEFRQQGMNPKMMKC